MRSAVPLGLLLLLAPLLRAQEELRCEGPSPATVRLGDSSQILLTIDGRDANPRTPELPTVDGLQLQVSPPSRQTFMQFDGRSMVERHSVQFTVVARPLREGAFTIPPIPIWTGTRTQRTPELRIDAVKDLRGEEFGFLEVTVEPARVYVHEPVWVRVEFGADAGLRPVTDVASNRYRYVDFEVQAPWLSRMEGAVPLELPDPQNATPVVLNRSLQMAEYTSAQNRGGRTWHAFAFDKAFLPTRAGRLELPAPLLRYHVLLREGRMGLFGERVGAQSQNYYVYGKPVQIEVLPIPEAGRPTPYYGAVGRFTVEAALDRNEVRVGDSVKLTFTVRGRGNLEFLRVPELDDLPGFHRQGQTEKRDQESVVVTYALTPLDASVSQVPPIGWNFFDTTPGVEKFVTVQTRALPLVVKPLENGAGLLPLAGANEARPVVPGVDDIFDLRPLDGPPVPLPDRPTPWLGWLAVLGPWLLAGALALVRAGMRRRAADPLGRRARAAAGVCRRVLADGGDPLDAWVGYLADRLGVAPAAVIGPDLRQRLQTAGLDAALADLAAAAVERGTAARYGGGAGLSADAVRGLVQQLEPVALRTLGSASLLLGVLAAALAAGPARGQEPAADPVAAYRAGDHRAAIAGFRQIAERTGDARAFYDLGNACYRAGDLPRAIWAWECARRGLPRDAELKANLALARRQLELGDGGGEPFLEALGQVRAAFTPGELLLGAGLLQAAAALLLLLGWRRRALRALGAIVLVPGLLLALEVLWWGPSRPALGIALQKVAVVAEPRADLPAVATLRPGAAVAVLGGGEAWVRVEAAGRSGYVQADGIARVR